MSILGSSLAPVPPATTMATTDDLPLPIDFTPQLLPAEVITSAVTTLVDKSVGRGVSITVPSPTVASPLVTQQLNGNLLSVGHIYWLRYVATTNQGNERTQILTVYCSA